MAEAEYVTTRLSLTRTAVEKFAQNQAPQLARAAALLVQTFRAGNKVLIFGNGGSASQAQHLACELVNKMLKDRSPLPALAPTTETSILTSVANDYEFEAVFEKQIRALGRPGDLAWGISTSGHSENVLRGLKAAGELKLTRLSLAGPPGSPIGKVSDLCLWVEAPSTPLIQEVHLAAAHIICELVEMELFGEGGRG